MLPIFGAAVTPASAELDMEESEFKFDLFAVSGPRVIGYVLPNCYIRAVDCIH
jgi:hypothetical protein